MNCTFQINEES